MKNLLIYSCFILACCLTACKKEVEKPVADTVMQDTLNNTYVPPYTGALSARADTLISINGNHYRVECHAVIDTLKKVSYKVTGNRDGKTYKSVYNGYDATYTISVKETNGNMLFTKTFTKNDFKGVVGEDALAQAIIEPAGFLGYHKGFDAFMFAMNFMIPESDVGDNCFLMIGMDGRVIEKSYNNSYGGGGPDGRIEIPTNNTYVLTCTKILHTNGKSVDIYNGPSTLVHTRLINDNTILVVYEPEEGDTNDNARLIDSNGKVLKTFTYKGYYDMLGYVAPHYFEKTTGTYILLDEELNNIRVIPVDNPLATFTISFDKLLGAKANPINEIAFDINTEVKDHAFAFDTVAKTVRLLKHEQ